MNAGEERWLLIAASSRGAAEHYAARRGISAALILDRRDLLAPPWRLRARIREAGVDRAAIHSLDWERERAPQLAELALGIAPVATRLLIDEASGATRPQGAGLAARAAARLPFELAAAGAIGGGEAVRLLGKRPGAAPRGVASPAAVLAIWPGSSGEVGGAVTHMSGILGALRRTGLRIGLASAGPVPAQLADAVDEVEVAAPPSRAIRLSKDAEQLTASRPLLGAAMSLAARSGADFVYQRHRAFLTCGTIAAARLKAPLVLEWNSSEAWMRSNWDRPVLRAPGLERIVASTERRVVAASSLIAAVSSQAAAMALEAGGAPERVRVVPNGVDLAAVDRARERTPREGRERSCVGWIGSFGPWHGAPVLIRALSHVGPEVEARMIGDGPGRGEALSLAESLGVAGRVEWTGALPHDEALASLAGCDVLASPHVPASERPFFGSPTKLFEYMALGRPIVASRLGQIGEVLEHERTALLVEPGDERGLASAISRLLADPEEGDGLGRAARLEAEQRHTWDRRATDLVAALEAGP